MRQTGGIISAPRLMLVLAFLVIVSYGRCVNYPFVYDDLPGILDDPLISHAETIGQASRAFLQPLRPATEFTYALTHSLFGFSRTAFHLTNVLIHLVNTFLVFGIGMVLARRWLPDINPAHFAFVGAAVHAVHPMYTEAVTYVTGRSSSLCALFYFACLLSVTQAVESRDVVRRRFWTCAALVSGLLAWQAKEEAMTLPLIAAAFLMLVGHRRLAAGLMLVPIVLLTARWEAIANLYRVSAANEPLAAFGLGAPVQTWPYVFSEIKAAVFYYMSHFAVPLTQSVDPYFRTVQSIVEPGFLVSAATILALTVVALRFSTTLPLFAFSIFALLVSPLLAYAFVPLPDLIAEHRVYIAGLGFDLLIAWLLSRSHKTLWLSTAAVIISLTTVTLARNSVWASDIDLWQQAERVAPNKLRPHLNLGAALQATDRSDQALVEYRHALLIRSDLPLVYSNLGTIYLKQGRIDDAEAMLTRAIELSPRLPQAYINLASIAVNRKKADEAFDYLAKAEKAGALGDWLHFIRAEALELSGQINAARSEYRTAEELSEDDRQLHEEIQRRLEISRK